MKRHNTDVNLTRTINVVKYQDESWVECAMRNRALSAGRTLHSYGFRRGDWIADVISEEFTCYPDDVDSDYRADGEGEDITINGQHVATLWIGAQMTTQTVYRLTLDENGKEDCRDYTARTDATTAFHYAVTRRNVFSARLQILRFDGADATSVHELNYWERRRPVERLKQQIRKG